MNRHVIIERWLRAQLFAAIWAAELHQAWQCPLSLLNSETTLIIFSSELGDDHAI